MSVNVSIQACADYERETVRASLEAVLAPLGGLDWVTKGMKIAIKANMVSRMKPETGGVTHPTMVSELCAMLVERGAEVVVGDSPGGPFTGAWVSGIYSGCGMRAVEDAGATLNRDFSTMDVSIPEGKAVQGFPYTAYLDKVDAVINFAKLKTHGLTGITCAVKNLFGVIPGTAKPEFHYRHPTVDGFSNMLIDINLYVKTKLTLVDAVTCMEGNGPTNGTPRHMGAVLAAHSNFDMDLVCAHLMGLDVENAPTVRLAAERGLCADDWQSLNVAGDVDSFAQPDFEKLPIREDVGLKRSVPIVGAVLKRLFTSRPKVEPEKCIGCGKCADHCPVDTIIIKNKKAIIKKKKCISCFCCQEFCPVGAIKVERPLGRK